MSISRKIGAVVALACVLGWASGATAQATRTWISGVGDDANPCSRTAPCETLAGAFSKTAAGGEINVLDPGSYGALTITKAITIGTDPALGGVLNPSVVGISINAGVNDAVVLRGLSIQGAATGGAGVRFVAGRSLTIVNSDISGDRLASPSGVGVDFSPSAGATTLTMINTKVYNNGNAGGGGILIQPTSTASVQSLLTNVTATGNIVGLRADASNTTGAVRVMVLNSTFSANTNGGVAALSVNGAGNVSVSLQNVTSSNNGQGINVNGPNTTVRFASSTIVGNVSGVQPFAGGVAQSYGNNVIGNVSGNDGTWTTAALR